MKDTMNDKIFLLSCTVRYCLGRQSYAVGWINELLKRHWNEIPNNDKKIILDDIKSYLKNKHATTLDRMLWNEILELGMQDGLIVREK